jgi:hypothetical protein
VARGRRTSLTRSTKAAWRAIVLGLLLGIAPLALPVVADAASVSVRIEAAGGPLLPATSVALPSSTVAPADAPDGLTCPGNTVIGALHGAVAGNWSGHWSAEDGWSIDRIKGIDLTGSGTAKWVAYVDKEFLNDPPCHKTLADGDSVLLFPMCTGGTTQCFSGGPLDLSAPATIGPGAPVVVQVWEINTTFNSQGFGTTQRAPAVNTLVSGPNGSAITDPFYGKATLSITNMGPSTIATSRAGRVPDRAPICVTEGADGYCGTVVPTPNPFDPLAFCTTTGTDGYCGSPDRLPPVGHITAPVQAKAYSKGAGPKLFKGTVDFDPSQVAGMQIRLMRQTTITVTTYKKKKVTVKRRVKGKIVRKRVTKKVPVRRKQTACYSWNTATSAWKRLKKCDPTLASLFSPDGDEVWSYEFLAALPSGQYTLDALSKDGAGNIDSAPELGRNRVTFKVA